MTEGENGREYEPAAGRFEEDDDADLLVGRITDRLVQMERGKVRRRRLKWIVIGLLILLVLGGGVFLCEQYGANLLRELPFDRK